MALLDASGVRESHHTHDDRTLLPEKIYLFFIFGGLFVDFDWFFCCLSILGLTFLEAVRAASLIAKNGDVPTMYVVEMFDMMHFVDVALLYLICKDMTFFQGCRVEKFGTFRLLVLPFVSW